MRELSETTKTFLNEPYIRTINEAGNSLLCACAVNYMAKKQPKQQHLFGEFIHWEST